MYPWSFCPACHLVPLWSLLHTLYPIWAAGLGQGEKDLWQNPNCIKLSNKALLSLKEKRIKNSCYIYSGQKKKLHSQITGSPSSLIELCQQQPSHFSFPSITPSILQSERLIIVCPKKWLVTAQKLFLIPDSVLPCLLWVPLLVRGPVPETDTWKNIWHDFPHLIVSFEDFRVRCNTKLRIF